MAYWLFKSEPDGWSWDRQVAKGEQGEEWDGVRNYQARNFMREMKIGDLGFFYHTQRPTRTAAPTIRAGNAWTSRRCGPSWFP